MKSKQTPGSYMLEQLKRDEVELSSSCSGCFGPCWSYLMLIWMPEDPKASFNLMAYENTPVILEISKIKTILVLLVLLSGEDIISYISRF